MEIVPATEYRVRTSVDGYSPRFGGGGEMLLTLISCSLYGVVHFFYEVFWLDKDCLWKRQLFRRLAVLGDDKYS